VAAALAVLPAEVDVVLVHDAARPLVPPALVDAVVRAVRDGAPAVVPGVPVTDTVKRVDAAGVVIETPPREQLRAVQTPQGFRRDVLLRAHALPRGAAEPTDDAGLVETLGEPVLVVPGADEAFKVTRPADLGRAEALLAVEASRARATGGGFDRGGGV
jgi:2-C-methyl-D-erythritol 4-phosphate cytidylyltransferase